MRDSVKGWMGISCVTKQLDSQWLKPSIARREKMGDLQRHQGPSEAGVGGRRVVLCGQHLGRPLGKRKA